jgi:hypothetical protein
MNSMMYDCEHRKISNDQRMRCTHRDGDFHPCDCTTFHIKCPKFIAMKEKEVSLSA